MSLIKPTFALATMHYVSCQCQTEKISACSWKYSGWPEMLTRDHMYSYSKGCDINRELVVSANNTKFHTVSPW